jgi:hypothetical protein
MTEPPTSAGEVSGTGEEERTCAKCGERPAGPGGVLCGPCLDQLTQQYDNYWAGDADRI